MKERRHLVPLRVGKQLGQARPGQARLKLGSLFLVSPNHQVVKGGDQFGKGTAQRGGHRYSGRVGDRLLLNSAICYTVLPVQSWGVPGVPPVLNLFERQRAAVLARATPPRARARSLIAARSLLDRRPTA